MIAKKAGAAVHILDRFHIMAHLGKAIDEVRAQEAKELKAKGYEPVLTKTRWLLLKLRENLTGKQEVKLSELLQYNLKSIRAYLLKEEFQLFWQYTSPYWAGVFLDKWCTKTMRSKIEPMKKKAKMLRRHPPVRWTLDLLRRIPEQDFHPHEGEVLPAAKLGCLAYDPATPSTFRTATAVLVGLDRQMQFLIAVLEQEMGNFQILQT